MILRQSQADAAAASMRGDALLHTNAILRQSCCDVQAINDSLRTRLHSKVAISSAGTLPVLRVLLCTVCESSAFQGGKRREWRQVDKEGDRRSCVCVCLGGSINQ